RLLRKRRAVQPDGPGRFPTSALRTIVPRDRAGGSDPAHSGTRAPGTAAPCVTRAPGVRVCGGWYPAGRRLPGDARAGPEWAYVWGPVRQVAAVPSFSKETRGDSEPGAAIGAVHLKESYSCRSGLAKRIHSVPPTTAPAPISRSSRRPRTE